MKSALFTIALLALACSCATAPSAAPSAPVAASASGDHIFKYTITTKIADAKDQIDILVAMNQVESPSPIQYDLDCEGDGEFEYKGLTKNQACVYKKNSGRHQIAVRGEITAMLLCDGRKSCPPCPEGCLCRPCFPDADDSPRAVVSVDSWGNLSWKTMHAFAAECAALDKLPEDAPDLRQVNDLSEMFYGARAFNHPIGNWDVSHVTDMSAMFYGATAFNQPLENWDTSNVTHMSWMFHWAKAFNQPLEAWNTSSVLYLSGMFEGATAFNQPLEKWNTSNVTHMDAMFFGATAFDQPLDQWDLSKVTSMNSMFKGAKAFSHYPKNWVVPANASREMFDGTKVEAEAQKSPLKTR